MNIQMILPVLLAVGITIIIYVVAHIIMNYQERKLNKEIDKEIATAKDQKCYVKAVQIREIHASAGKCLEQNVNPFLENITMFSPNNLIKIDYVVVNDRSSSSQKEIIAFITYWDTILK
jgi:hypothetical protein